MEPNRAYVVDEDVQLVCKYLKAYQVGGKNGIDKLYKECKCYRFFKQKRVPRCVMYD